MRQPVTENEEHAESQNHVTIISPPSDGGASTENETSADAMLVSGSGVLASACKARRAAAFARSCSISAVSLDCMGRGVICCSSSWRGKNAHYSRHRLRVLSCQISSTGVGAFLCVCRLRRIRKRTAEEPGREKYEPNAANMNTSFISSWFLL